MKRPVKRHEVIQPLDQSYRLIPLTKGQTTKVDVEDFERVSQYNWCAHWNPHTNSFYARSWAAGRIMMHKFILEYGKDFQADHKNYDTLDNRKENLRVCTPTQNSQARRKRANTSSKYKGVCKLRNGWLVQIRVNGKLIKCGIHKSEEKAALIYNEAAKKHFGEFAQINHLRST